MKFDYENLKERIKICKERKFPNPIALIEEWYEGSEKEVREKLATARRDSKYEVNWKHIADLKEILGE